MTRNREFRIGQFVLILALAWLAWGCGGQEEPPAVEQPAPEPEVTQGGPEPPSGGDIIVDPGGYKQDKNGTITDITYSTATTMWIPTGFTGQVTEIAFDPGGGNPVIRFVGDVEIHFPSNAQIKITPGNPATWKCKMKADPDWSACATQSGTTISSMFKVRDNNTNASVSAVGGTGHSIAAGTKLTVK